MKKRLEAELISIAHRILKLKNKSEVDQLYKETQKLYETLTVLKFYQDNFESVKEDVSEAALEEKLGQDNEVSEPNPKPEETAPEVIAEEIPEAKPEPETETTEEEINTTVEPEAEEEVAAATEEEVPAEEPLIEEKPSFQPIFELEPEEIQEPAAPEVKSEEKLEDMIGNYADPVFVKPGETSLFPSDANATEKTEQPAEEPKEAAPKAEEPKSIVNKDVSGKTIVVGLNDRIGFVQHLFNDSNEDFNRVISQLNTFDTFEEAKTFINEMVIPDYNYWVGEEDYIERFMAIVEKKFE